MRHARARAAVAALALLALAACTPPAPPVATGSPSPPGTPSPSPSPAAWSVAAENAQPGTPDWRLTRTGPPRAIEGWADATSVVTGGSVGLHVSTTAPTFTVHAIRMGWYAGVRGRQVWASSPLPGRLLPPGRVGPLGMVTTDWPVSTVLSTAGWPPGSYLLRLDASTGQRYVPLQVRLPSARGAVVIVSADTTWQAYNSYGGYSLYQGPNGAFATRARQVSFDRPYGPPAGQGQSEYLENEEPLVAQAERLGLPLDYVSDLDLHAHPHLLDGARAVVFTGHDEYWSLAMRQQVLGFRDAGGNIAFLGANSAYRHIRMQPGPGGPDRVEVCYKIPTEDPLYGKDNADVTGQWRYPPDPRPESVLTGVFYRSNPVHADMVVVDPSAWMLAGTGAVAGLHLPGVVAPEFDRVDLAVPTPRPMQIIAHSPLVVRGRADTADAAYYSTPSGAGVFATGTIGWIKAMGGANGPAAAAFTTTVTANVLRAFAAGPAGAAHPAVDNVARFYGGAAR